MTTPPARYAVAGHPVGHSQSPFIHAEFARLTGEPVRYEALLCPLDDFGATVRRYAAGGAAGCNVTLPFKAQAHALAATATPRAARAGCCNTLVFTADGWHGDNTDGAGLVRDLAANAGFTLAGARVLLLGAGGAAAGVLGPLLDAGVTLVCIANRTRSRADTLVARHAEASAGRLAVIATGATGDAEVAGETGGRADGQGGDETLADAAERAFDLVINATSSSIAGAAPPLPARCRVRGALAVDLMYGPAARPFLAWAAAHGALGRDGVGMLVEQAAESFFVWRGVRPPTAEVLTLLRRRLDAAA